MRKLIVLAAVGATLVAAIPALAATRSVKVGDNYFVRDRGVPTVTVSKGTTVRWLFRGDSKHNVRVTSGPVTFASPIKSSGSFKRKMGRRGTYRIICDLHGAGDQSMKLVVK